jgi:hypothetical protein
MPETLLSPSNILLYGRQLLDLTIYKRPPDSRNEKAPPSTEPGVTKGEDDQPAPAHELPEPLPYLGDNLFLQRQLRLEDSRFARIYAFAFEGHYYDLPKPMIFLVHGPGSDPEAFRPAPNLPNARASRAPADADRTGVASTPSSFSEDIRVWAYDKGDFSMRLEPDSGPLEQILLERCLGGGHGAYGAAVSGAAVSGAGAFGAGAYGAAVSGAGAHGAGAFGAGAFGAGAFGRGRRGGD